MGDMDLLGVWTLGADQVLVFQEYCVFIIRSESRCTFDKRSWRPLRGLLHWCREHTRRSETAVQVCSSGGPRRLQSKGLGGL